MPVLWTIATQADRAGERYLCGIRATMELKRLVKDPIVTCKGSKRDRYRRLIATCFIHGMNLNASMVRQGLALAYRKYAVDYVVAERQAQADRLGAVGGKISTAVGLAQGT